MDTRIRADVPTPTSENERAVLPSGEAQQQLGPILATCEPNRLQIIIALCIYSVAGLLGMFSFYLGLQFWLQGTAKNLEFSIVMSGCFGLFMLLLSIRRLPVAWQALHTKVIVCRDGLALVTPERTATCCWDRIEAIYCKKPNPKYQSPLSELVRAGETYTIRTVDGDECCVSSYFKDIDGLVKIILRESAERLIPRMREKCDSGGSCAFGALSLDSRGVTKKRWLRKRGSTLPWEEVWWIENTAIKVVVMRKGRAVPWFEVRAKKVPNIHVLLALYEEFMARRK